MSYDRHTSTKGENRYNSVNVSCSSYFEHRASTTHCHRTLFIADTFTPFQFRPTPLASIWTDHFQVLFGRLLRLEPCGFHSRAVRLTSAWGFRNVCPNRPHFLRLISSSIETWTDLLHREDISLLIILDLGTGWGEWSASLPTRTLPPGKDPRHPLNRGLNGPQTWCRHRG
jgi:hypothetical protein